MVSKASCGSCDLAAVSQAQLTRPMELEDTVRRPLEYVNQGTARNPLYGSRFCEGLMRPSPRLVVQKVGVCINPHSKGLVNKGQFHCPCDLVGCCQGCTDPIIDLLLCYMRERKDTISSLVSYSVQYPVRLLVLLETKRKELEQMQVLLTQMDSLFIYSISLTIFWC